MAIAALYLLVKVYTLTRLFVFPMSVNEAASSVSRDCRFDARTNRCRRVCGVEACRQGSTTSLKRVLTDRARACQQLGSDLEEKEQTGISE